MLMIGLNRKKWWVTIYKTRKKRKISVQNKLKSPDSLGAIMKEQKNI